MKERHEQILGEVVRAYMNTGQPVSSRTVVEQGQLDLSPASVRHVMADLEKQGLLCSPHISAGRIPSDAGLRFFVDTLMVMDPDMQQAMEQVVSGHLNHAEGQQRLLKRATDELANLTHFAGLVWVHTPGVHQIRKLELVPVSSEHILAVIITDSGEVQNRLIHRPAKIGEDELRRISTRLSDLLCECDLAEARRRLHHEMEVDRMHIGRLLEDLKRWTEAPTNSQTDMFVSGQRQLLEIPEFGVIDTVRSLLATFEEKEQLLHLVDQVEREKRGVKVFIGSEHALVDMEHVSVVLSRYEGPMNVAGTLGVIGPKSMHYGRIMPIVDCTAKWVSRILGDMN